MVLSYSGLLAHGGTLKFKFPWAVMYSRNYATTTATGKQNLTFRSIQKHLARFLKESVDNIKPSIFFPVYLGWKGDWKFKVEWLELSQSYNKE